MYAIFKENRVTQPLYRPTRIGRARRVRSKAELSRATSCCADQIPLERQRQASLDRLRGFLSRVRAVLREWRQRKSGRLELARLDERMLHDIGLTRVDIFCEINKPFWRE
jgi:uncharacterized protein YjiS (DUF1127 family)